MASLPDVRAAALALPEATEQDHHGRNSFRVRGKIFATVPDEGHLNVMLGEHDIRAVAAADPACEEVWWGRKLSAVRVDLRLSDLAAVVELLTDAWRGKAPKTLLRTLDER